MTMYNLNDSQELLLNLCTTIIDSKEELSEIDGLIGDGDHGINMAKGFETFKNRIIENNISSLDKGFLELANVLMGEIGGSMGPLYGCFFLGMSTSIQNQDTLSSGDCEKMFNSGLENLQTITDAKLGDKSLMDTLIPVVTTFSEKHQQGKSFKESLMIASASGQAGAESTRALQAKIGRASRLGERSIGVLDAGAVSCAKLMSCICESISLKLS